MVRCGERNEEEEVEKSGGGEKEGWKEEHASGLNSRWSLNCESINAVQQKSEAKSETKLTERSISRHSNSLVQVESGCLSTTRSRSPFSSPIVAELGRLASQVEESCRRELLRTLAETHCLMAEVYTHYRDYSGWSSAVMSSPGDIPNIQLRDS